MAEVQTADLVEDLRNSVTHLNAIASKVAIEDMQDSFLVNREHLLMLCDAFLSARLTSVALNTIAFALIASDHFEWHDDTMSEVLHDWSAPEINFPLNEETIKMHRSWLTDTATPLQRQIIKQASTTRNRLISVREKVRPN
ncbi:MAG TPA: hypothetical protein VGG81_06970 [Edaphobacter sp.]|jgi:hypothetical protein